MIECPKEHKIKHAKVITNEYQQRFWGWECCGKRVPYSVAQRPATPAKRRQADGVEADNSFTRGLYERQKF